MILHHLIPNGHGIATIKDHAPCRIFYNQVELYHVPHLYFSLTSRKTNELQVTSVAHFTITRVRRTSARGKENVQQNKKGAGKKTEFIHFVWILICREAKGVPLHKPR